MPGRNSAQSLSIQKSPLFLEGFHGTSLHQKRSNPCCCHSLKKSVGEKSKQQLYYHIYIEGHHQRFNDQLYHCDHTAVQMLVAVNSRCAVAAAPQPDLPPAKATAMTIPSRPLQMQSPSTKFQACGRTPRTGPTRGSAASSLTAERPCRSLPPPSSAQSLQSPTSLVAAKPHSSSQLSPSTCTWASGGPSTASASSAISTTSSPPGLASNVDVGATAALSSFTLHPGSASTAACLCWIAIWRISENIKPPRMVKPALVPSCSPSTKDSIKA
mmetsp:Transcript_27663/g.45502  ORF Transcript_27663/g.45502 Transcript_27663/m.45502 type:complete len:271 (+) Transcript_27663:634-1446(+)